MFFEYLLLILTELEIKFGKWLKTLVEKFLMSGTLKHEQGFFTYFSIDIVNRRFYFASSEGVE